MLKRNSEEAKYLGGKLLWYDPNPIDNTPIDLSELTISVDLTVTSKSKSIITKDGVVNTGDKTSEVVSFFKGSQNNGSNSKDYKRTLTTNYTNYQDLNGDLSDDYEMLGIENININFNTSYAPTVKIKFIDVRGAALFSKGNNSKYKFFFEIPYPLFNLKVKGYYGKTVSYCLHLLKFNASFNSQTGNFEIDCDFIGYTYALLTDMLMGLVRASVTTSRGSAIFSKIKSEYKNPQDIITIDELVKKTSQISESIDKIKQSDAAVKAAKSEELKTLIEDLRFKVVNYLNGYGSNGLKLFTSESEHKNGILVSAIPTTEQQEIINSSFSKYDEDVKSIINKQIAKSGDEGLLDFNTISKDDTATTNIKLQLDPNTSDKTKGCKNFVDYLSIDKLKVDIIKSSSKLETELKTYTNDTNKIARLLNLLPTLDYGSTTEIRIRDFSSAINACDSSLTSANELRKKAIDDAVAELKVNIRSSLGFEPTIRNLFRILSISTEVFLQCILDVSIEADEDKNKTRQTAITPVINGLKPYGQGTSENDKIYPWPEYRKANVKNNTDEEEWLGNDVPPQKVPELSFTEELLREMINQRRADIQDEIKNDEIGIGWWPVSVLDIPIGNSSNKMTQNPYFTALVQELDGTITPKTTADEALRVMMYRCFLLLGVVNRNDIPNSIKTIYAKLEAENLYQALLYVPNKNDAKTIKDKIIAYTNDDIYKLFSTNYDSLEVSGRNANRQFFKENGGFVEYKYITKASSNRSYIPINGGFHGSDFLFSDDIIKDPKDLIKVSDKILFVSNVTNHTRTKNNDSTFGVLDTSYTDNNDGVDNISLRFNYVHHDGSVSFRIFTESEYNQSSLLPTFGNDVVTSITTKELNRKDISASIKDKTKNAGYINALKSTPYNVNTYTTISYDGGEDEEELGDNVPNTKAPSFLTFFNNPSTTEKSLISSAYNFYGTATSYEYPKYNYSSLVHTGLAYDYVKSEDKYNWHLLNTNTFTALNTLTKQIGINGYTFLEEKYYPKEYVLPYKNYGNNRAILNSNGKIYIPKIEYCVDKNYTYSLFGSDLYYAQNSTKLALIKDKKNGILKDYTVTVGNASKAFLFLHSLPFIGVSKYNGYGSYSTKSWDMFMFDYNNEDNKYGESINVNDTNRNTLTGEDSLVLGIKGLFRLNNGFIEAPRAWTLFIGAILWRMHYNNNNTTQVTVNFSNIVNNPFNNIIQTKLYGNQGVVPITTNFNTTYFNPVTAYSNISPSAGITPSTTPTPLQVIQANIQAATTITTTIGEDPITWKDSNGNYLIPKLTKPPRVDEFLNVVTYTTYIPANIQFSSEINDYGTDLNKESKLHYSRIDETIMGLPNDVKSELIIKFIEWVDIGFKSIQSSLEINVTDLKDYRSKWNKLNNTYTQSSGTKLELKISDIKNILGNNIFENYSMVCPISNGPASVTTEVYNIGNTPIINDDYGGQQLRDYVINQNAFNMILNPEGEGMSLISRLVTEKTYIQNGKPSNWNPPVFKETGVTNDDAKNKRQCFEPIKIKKTDLDEFINNFKSHFETLTNDLDKTLDEEEKKIQQELFNSMEDDKIKLNIYRTLSSIYQKWISGLNGEIFSQCSVNPSDKLIATKERNSATPRLIDSFRFLDRAFNDIGDEFYINPKIFQNLIRENGNSSFFDIINKILSDNNFNFIPLPTFVNFNEPEVLSKVFEPYAYNDDIISGPSFVCVYVGQSSTNLDLGNNQKYYDDGIFIYKDENGNFVGLPNDMTNGDKANEYETNLPIFNVNYGQQNQSYFKDVKLDQSEFSETAESLEIMDDISQGGDKLKSVSTGQNLFNVYQKRSYSCEIEMLGCALIQPMMYFQLNNIPMFRGLYLIINVSHNITPNNMSTTFKGVRVKRTKTPLLTASDVLMGLIGDVSSINTSGNNTAINSSNSTSGPVTSLAGCPVLTLNTTETKTTDDIRTALNNANDIGLTENAIKGIMGNLYMESGFKPGNYNTTQGGCGAYGLAQWRNAKNTGDKGRQTDLYNFISNLGLPSNDINGQAKFIMHELKNTYKGTYNALKESTISVEAAARIVYLTYELTSAGQFTLTISDFNDEQSVQNLINTKKNTSDNELTYKNADLNDMKERVDKALTF